jgi:nitrogen-specific signal transduction histidine kinase
MNRRAQTVAWTSACSSGRLLHSRRLDKTSINNGMDAMSHLPIELRILTLRTSSQVETMSGFLVVEDEGSGIPDALKERLFRHSLLPRVMASVWDLRFAARFSKASADPLLAETARNGGAAFYVQLPLAT